MAGWNNAMLVTYPCGSGEACTNHERPGFHDEAQELRERIDKYELAKACIEQHKKPKRKGKAAEDRLTSS